jgi:hypothetical protein
MARTAFIDPAVGTRKKQEQGGTPELAKWIFSSGAKTNSLEETMIRTFAIGTLIAALAIVGSAQLSAQDNGPGNQVVLLIPDGKTVYDVVNQVTWLADANLATTSELRFGLPLCDPLVAQQPGPCVNASGSMSYTSAQAWILAMNAHNYLGHSTWQLPTTPTTDHSCDEKGPQTNNFGFGCKKNALGYLYYKALGIEAPNTAVPIPTDTVGPFKNFQPALYWSNTPGDGTTGGLAVFSFASGAQGGSTKDDFLFVLPMIDGKLPGMPASHGMGLEVSPDGKTIYDPRADVTWLADANLAAHDTFRLPRCETPTTPQICVAEDGSMDYNSALWFMAKMNVEDGVGYLGQTNWKFPPVDPGCPTYNCSGMGNPMGELFYLQLHKSAGEPVVEAPDIAVGPFHHVQPSQYWSCVANLIQDACEVDGEAGKGGAQFGFSFGDGFLGTTGEPAFHFVTAYYVGCDLPDQKKCTEGSDQ